MTINVRNFCYREDIFSKFDALAAVEDLFTYYISESKHNYIPVPDNGRSVLGIYSEVPIVFISVKSLTPAMLFAFQNCDRLSAHQVNAQLNSAVYDYAVNVVKELLVDEDIDVVHAAIRIAYKYRLYSHNLLPTHYHNYFHQIEFYFLSEKDVRECGKMLHDAIA